METPCMYLLAGSTRKVTRRTWRLCNPQSTHAPPRRDRGGQNTCLDIPLAGVCRGALSRKQWRLALSKLEKIFEVGKHEWMELAWVDVSYFAYQLTDDAIFLRWEHNK